MRFTVNRHRKVRMSHLCKVDVSRFPVGLVHAMILRIQALLLPVQTLVLKGH